MSKKPKPQWQSPPTQDSALSSFKPMGFYAPYGNVTWGNDGYSAALDNPYMNTQAVDQYQGLRNRLLGEVGLTGQAREDSLNEYGNAFLNKSLEYSAPKLKAMTYGRGQAGSRMGADAYADLVNKASTDAVLSREQLRNMDEQIKMQQLQAAESGLTGDLNRQLSMISQLLQGTGVSQGAEAQSVNQANQYVQAQNALEAERYQRELQSWQEQQNRWQAAVALGAAPFTGGASMMMMPSGSLGGGINTSSLGGMSSMMGGFGGYNPSAGGMNPFGGGQAGWAVPGMNGYGMNTPSGVFSTGSQSMLPATAFAI